MATQEERSAAEAEQQMTGQKRTAAEAAEPLLSGIQAIVLDVEGTTLPGSYLKSLLTCETLQAHLKDTVEEPETIKDLAALRELSQKEKDDGVEGAEPIPATADNPEAKQKEVSTLADNVQRWIDTKPDCAEFKQFRDHVLHHLFNQDSDKFKPELFEDVVPMLRMLSEEGYSLYLYSSETEDYYKMLFTNTSQGDITDVITKIFDVATMGSKTEPSSYKKISAEMKIAGPHILYLTDTPEEAEAARLGGWRCALVIRPGNVDLTDDHLQSFACIEQLDELYGEDDDEDVKRFHGDDNGEAEGEDDDDEEENEDDEVDEEDEGEDEDGEGGEDA